MYEDNAWPDTASIETFIKKRKRPQQVFIGGIALLVAGGLALLTGLLYPVAADRPDPGFILLLPGAVMIGFGVIVAGWLAVLARVMLKGGRWAPKPARWSAGAVAVIFGLIGLLAIPDAAVQTGKVFGWFYVILLFGAVLASVVTLLCLLGKQVEEFFAPPVEPSPFAQQDAAPLGGNDADWGIPPAQHQPQQQPPQYGQGPYGGPPQH